MNGRPMYTVRMPRDAVARLRSYLNGSPSPPWIRAVAVCIALAGASLVVWWRESGEAYPPTRIAIRVDCHELSKCALAEALAFDVWSEQRGPEIPLDVVVSETVLPQLD